MKSCVICQSFTKCKDISKSYSYICSAYKPVDLNHEFGEGNLFLPSDFSIEGTDKKAKGNSYSANNDKDDVIVVNGTEEDELNLIKYIEGVFDPSRKVGADTKVDDRDLKEFPNFFEFSTSSRGLGIRPFARQMWIAIHIFAEWCPDCSDPTLDFRDIYSIPVDSSCLSFTDRIQMLDFGVCPKCSQGKSDLVKSGKLNFYSEFAGCIGQRGGKSAFLAMLSTYVIKKYLKMQRPTEVLGLLPNSILTGTYVGLTFDRSVALLWNPILNAIKSSPWFVEYHKLLDYYSIKYSDKNLYRIRNQFVEYRHRNLFFSPSGPNKRTLRGDNRILGAGDEIGWFVDSDTVDRASASETYVSLDNSLVNVRSASRRLLHKGHNNIISSLLLFISSPSSYTDKIMTLVRSHKGSKTGLGVHLATWEFNPNLPRYEFNKNFAADPVKATRDFGADPPMSKNELFPDIEQFRNFIGDFKNKLQYKTMVTSPKNSKTNADLNRGGKPSLKNRKKLYAVIKDCDLPPTVYPSIMSFDAGETNNSFAIAIITPKRIGENRITREITALAEVIPIQGMSIDYNKIYHHFLGPIVEKFNVKVCVSDRWQSTKIMDDLEHEYNIIPYRIQMRLSEFYSVYDYFTVDSDYEEPLIKIPKPEISLFDIETAELGDSYKTFFHNRPVAHFLYQCLTVEDNGKNIIKGPNLTDDLFRAVFTGLYVAFQQEPLEEVMSKEADNSQSEYGLGAFAIGRQGSKNTGVSNTKYLIGNNGDRGGYSKVGIYCVSKGSRNIPKI